MPGEGERSESGAGAEPHALLAGSVEAEPAPPAARIAAGTPAFRRLNAGLFAAGFATFALLYSVQPLLPLFADEFGTGAAGASLALSLSTGTLAVALLVASSLSEVTGRKPVMLAALFSSAILTLAVALADDWSVLLALRAATGLALSGLPAVAMAFLVDEVDRPAVGRAMGLYIGGSAIGGMSGRLLVALLADHFGWRVALGVTGAVGLVAAVLLWRFLPPARHFVARRPDVPALARSLLAHLGDRGLVLLFAEGFLLMGAFVTLYNYLGFRLLAPPYGLGHGAVGAIFTTYLFGTVASAWMGTLSDRFSRRRVLPASIAVMAAGLGLTMLADLAAIVAGVALFTFGFFGAHSVASGWVGLRAETAKAQASSLYLLAYYAGSSLAGTAGGLLWTAGGWTGVAGFVAALTAMAIGVSWLLARTPPPAWMRRAG
ncbi:inner membrane transport protein YnfM [Pleomorphomonas sp. SM30]|uniref:YNFM family putative membrane transporter n=2 Tax=Oharaeibacter diazotrophicus TaxID=1920512 RepID=A0A4R6RJ19_9HYPH|nr:MFS transporter [Oharaeibacter diazotrophicus]TDP86440.1 YNFM family putative membrane transporter [Oharaeibacter diazotrophicus]BBE71618.1 inner membrane transport protein YnfM [Pleomorphomonas sp. SM30]GLS78380.1 MFS transporter [Oharaeibacter diazotrophicus]